MGLSCAFYAHLLVRRIGAPVRAGAHRHVRNRFWTDPPDAQPAQLNILDPF